MRIIKLTGIKTLLFGLIALASVIAIFLFILNIFILIIPIAAVLFILGYFFRLFRRKKAKSKEASYIDAEYKIKK